MSCSTGAYTTRSSSTRVLVYLCAGVPVYRYVAVPVYQYVGLPVYLCVQVGGVLVH